MGGNLGAQSARLIKNLRNLLAPMREIVHHGQGPLRPGNPCTANPGGWPNVRAGKGGV